MARAGEHVDPVRVLEDLMRVDMDTLAAYQIASGHLDDPDYKRQIEEFAREIEHHLEALRPEVTQLGGQPPEGPNAFEDRLLSAGFAIVDLTGDRSVLKAVRRRLKDAHSAYGRAAGLPELQGDIHEFVARAWGDADRQRRWLDATLRTM